MPPLLQVTDLCVRYGNLVALDGIDVAVPAGSVVAVLGPNGAGKSTLLRAVAGLVPVQRGDVRLAGESIVSMPPYERARRGVCLIPEGRGIFPSLTVADNLAIALGGDRERVHRVLEHFPVLGERRRQLAATLSGGQQQMLALARAVSGDDAILMADELSLGLAPRLVRTIRETLERLHDEEGRTILLVEQYVTQALRMADLVFILSSGAVVWAAEPAEVLASRVLVESYLGMKL